MKAIKNILFVHKDDRSLSPLFKAILQRETTLDLVLQTVGLRVDSAGLELPGAEISEGNTLENPVRSALKSLGIKNFQHSSKSMRLHPDLIRWADLILVPGLMEEDLLCLTFDDAWSRTVLIECYCGEYGTKTNFPLSGEATEMEYLSATETFKALLPDLIDRVKDSFASALIAKGIGMNKGTAVGNAYIAKRGKDLLHFTKEDVLVVDRPGTLMFKDMNKAMATSIIERFVESPVVTSDLQDILDDFQALLEGKAMRKNKWLVSGLDAFRAVLSNAKALICSRGRHSGEHLAINYNIPCVSSCIGATEYIANGQPIAIDAERGEVYDVRLLQNLAI